jgi:hypothetical protein
MTQGSAVESLPGERGCQSQLREPAPAASAPVRAPETSCAIPRPRKVARADRVGGEIALATDPHALCVVFGIEDPGVAVRLLSQLINFIQPDLHKPADAVSINQMLALIEGIGPSNTLEAMTATMLLGAQHAAIDSLRRACHPDQTPAGRQSYTALGLKAMRTFAQLVEALHVGRGRAVRQEINVTHQHVTVEVGGQAMVGAIDPQRGRG